MSIKRCWDKDIDEDNWRSRSLKIAIDARWIFPEISGVGAYTRELIRHLARLDSDNTYVLLCDSDEQRDRVVRDTGIADRATFSTVVFPASLFSIRSQLLLPRLLKRYGVDVYHSPNYMIPFLAFPRHRRGIRTKTVPSLNFSTMVESQSQFSKQNRQMASLVYPKDLASLRIS